MDPCLLENLWATHLRLFRHIAFAIVRQTDIVDEVIQEAFRRALRSGFSLASTEEALLYLKRIVTNTSIDYYHLSRKQPTEELKNADRVADPPASSPLDQLIEKEQQSLSKKRLDYIRREIVRLPQEQRFIIERLVLQEQPQTLTALSRTTGIPISTLRSRFIAGLDRIRNNLRKAGLSDIA